MPRALEYERAAQLRDQIKRLEMRALGIEAGNGHRAAGVPVNGRAAAGRSSPMRGKGRSGAKGGRGRTQSAPRPDSRRSRLKLIPDDPD